LKVAATEAYIILSTITPHRTMPPKHEALLEKGFLTDVTEIRLTEAESNPFPTREPWKWVAATTRRSFSPNQNSRNVKLHKTAYLDGLRGFASLLVYCLHHQVWAHSPFILENAYGYQGFHHLACLPGVRLLFTGGHFAVAVFFVISGYVLSAKPLTLIHAGDFDRMSENIGSALFRRWLRLYIPVICSTLITASIPHVWGIKANFEPQRIRRDELWKWYCEFKNFSFAFRLGGEPWFSYSFHTWSIPFEFRGSICVYTSLLAFSRCTRLARLGCEAGLIIYFLYIADGAHFAMFMAGMLLCDLDNLAERQQLPKWMGALSSVKTQVYYAMFTLALILGGCPSHQYDIQLLKESPGWSYFAFLVPQAVFDFKWFFLFWGAVFLVASTPRLPWLKGFFETRFCQYLGRISFAFYLVHGPVLWTLGQRLYAATGWYNDWQAAEIPGWVNRVPLPRVGPLGLELSFLVPHLILLPVTLWLAEIATTVFDEPSIQFSRWLYGLATTFGDDTRSRGWNDADRPMKK
jgi:peptidoglycan/LPS O-acetylase OafA/YrhL